MAKGNNAKYPVKQVALTRSITRRLLAMIINTQRFRRKFNNLISRRAAIGGFIKPEESQPRN